MIFPCKRCGCMPPGPADDATGSRSVVCGCPTDQLNTWWAHNTPRFEQDRQRARLVAWESYRAA